MKQDFRRWANRQIRETPEPWPLWARLLALVVLAALCGIVMVNLGVGR